MDVFASQECIIKVRLRSEGAFKLNSKKYRVSPPYGYTDGGKTFQSFIEFQTDIFKKTILVSRGADGEYQERKIDMEIFCNDQIIKTHEIELSQHAKTCSET